MKTIHLTFMIMLVLTTCALGQTEDSKTPRWGVGLQVSQYQNDFGIGLNATSAPIANKVSVRLRWNRMYHQHVYINETVWTAYHNVGVGLLGFSSRVSASTRLYGEGGVLGLLVSSRKFSDQNDFGGYGLFGFEFLSKTGGYFIEIGGAGTGAKATLLPDMPIYSNGLTVSAGFRLYN